MKYFFIFTFPSVIRSFIFAGLGVATFASFDFHNFATAKAGNRVKNQYTTSMQPYWVVGNFNHILSKACRRGEFIQRRVGSYTIGYLGKRGRGITGIAIKGWNLIDTNGLSKPNFTYHFKNQGFSNCKVFVAKTPKINKQ